MAAGIPGASPNRIAQRFSVRTPNTFHLVSEGLATTTLALSWLGLRAIHSCVHEPLKYEQSSRAGSLTDHRKSGSSHCDIAASSRSLCIRLSIALLPWTTYKSHDTRSFKGRKS